MKSDVVAISSLIEQLVGGSRFFDEDTAIKVEDENQKRRKLFEFETA